MIIHMLDFVQRLSYTLHQGTVLQDLPLVRHLQTLHAWALEAGIVPDEAAFLPSWSDTLARYTTSQMHPGMQKVITHLIEKSIDDARLHSLRESADALSLARTTAARAPGAAL